MAINLKPLRDELKKIREYLIKIGPSRRKGSILETRSSEALKIYKEYNTQLIDIEKQITLGTISGKYVPFVKELCDEIDLLYSEIIKLCTIESQSQSSEKEGEHSQSTMDTFDLKTALNLLPIMTDSESNTKQLIDAIDYYSSLLTKPECKKHLINFILKSRLSSSAKLRLSQEYTSIDSLLHDMRSLLLPQKSASALHTKLHQIRQENMSINDYGQEISQLFVDLTISQSNGDTSKYAVLKPINEKLAIKRFTDGLRNRRLSTVISARNYSTLKDAVQAALDEETSSSTGELMTLRNYNNYTYNMRNNTKYRGRYNNNFRQFRGSRGPARGQYRGYYNRGTSMNYSTDVQQRATPAARGSRSVRGINPGMSYFNNQNQWGRNRHTVQTMIQDTIPDHYQEVENNQEVENLSEFFRA